MLDTNLSNQPPKKRKITEGYMGKTLWCVIVLQFEVDSSFPAIGLNVGEGKSRLVNKTRASLRYIYQHHMHDAEWFLKADDDTYMIKENLRCFLSKLNPSDPHYIGRMFTRLQQWRGRLRFQPWNVKNIQESAGRAWIPTRRWWRYICSKMS